MRVLEFHVDHIEFEPVRKEIELAEESEKGAKRLEEAVAMFVSVEPGDDERVAEEAVRDVAEYMSKLKVKRLVIYPFAHLSNSLARPHEALQILAQIERKASETGLEVTRSPFGWNKALELKVKGHPLAERSRVFTAGARREEGEKPRPTPPKTYYVLTPDGQLHSPADYRGGGEEFMALVEKEALGRETAATGQPEYIKVMKRLGIDWEPMSDLGHMRYGPEGAFIFDQIADYASQVVQTVGIPVYNVKGTNMFSLEDQAIREHAGLFGQRMYQVNVEGHSYVMRYAACFQQFALLKDWVISYRHLPFGEFEVADSYRLEQSGELVLGFRVRRMNMPDFHVFCSDIEEAKTIFKRLHDKLYEVVEKMGRDYVSLYNLTSRDFFEQNRAFFVELVRRERKPVLLCFYPEDANYYWVLNIEYHIIDKLNRPREIGTVQIDTGNAARFGISYVDSDGCRKHPVILHTAMLGTVERYLYLVLDTALRQDPPTLPSWLCPVQVRVIPVAEKYLRRAMRIASTLHKFRVRADVDDRSDTVDRKVRDAEVSWIPYIVFIGRREVKSGRLTVRVRRQRKQRQMSIATVVKQVAKETRGYPWRPLPLPMRVSERPVYS